MANHSTSDQQRFLAEWFRTWSEYQKDDFLHVLTKKLQVLSSTFTDQVDVLVNGLQNLNDSGRPPSLFACQIKLFNEWWDSWSEEDRGKLTEQLKNNDGKFWADVENELDGSRVKDLDDFFTVVESNSEEPSSLSAISSLESNVEIITSVTPDNVIEVTPDEKPEDSASNEDEVNENQQEPDAEKFKTMIEIDGQSPQEEKETSESADGQEEI